MAPSWLAYHGVALGRRLAILQGDAVRSGVSSMRVGFATGASKADIDQAVKDAHSSQSSNQQQATPTYVYASPGTSMRDASYGFSIRDPVYMVDPAPEKLKPVTSTPQTKK